MTWAFADHVWQSTLFAVAAGGLALALRKNMARVRYWVWFTASVKFLVPLSLLMQLGSQVARVAAAPGTTPLPATAFAVRQVARPFSSVWLTGPVATREAALKTALLQLRQAIDRYQAEQHKYPDRLTVLVRDGYLKAIPTDPVTGRRDSWRMIVAKPGSEKTRGTAGNFDVRSGSRGAASDGTRYADW